MLPQSAADGVWSWMRRQNELEFRGSGTSGTPQVSMSSVLPTFWPARPSEMLTALLLGAAIVILTAAIAEFLARRFFLIDVTDPVLVSRSRRIGSLAGTNLFVICRSNFDQAQIQYWSNACIDLAKDKFEHPRERRALLNRIGLGQPVVVRHFEYRHFDVNTTKAKLGLLDALVSESGSSLVVIAEQGEDGEALGLREAWRLASPPAQKSRGMSSDRPDAFASLLESLVMVDVSRWEQGWVSFDRRQGALRSPPSIALRLIQSESRGDAHLRRVWTGMEESLQRIPSDRAEPSREELLDLLGERAESYYRAIWDSCQTAERVVLVNLAHYGLVNDKDRRTLRRLLARGLVRRMPHFTIMNETFRRYLLGRSAEIWPDIPRGADSPWDSVRRPALAIVASLTILLFVTQQELFSATSAIITALASGVASFSRISGLFDSRRGNTSGSSG